MKVTCTLLAVAAGTIVLLADRLTRRPLPWCALLDGDEQQCNYYTQQECLETVSGVGGVCIMNPAAGSQQAAQPMQYPSSENAQGLFLFSCKTPVPPN